MSQSHLDALELADKIRRMNRIEQEVEDGTYYAKRAAREAAEAAYEAENPTQQIGTTHSTMDCILFGGIVGLVGGFVGMFFDAALASFIGSAVAGTAFMLYANR